MLERLSGVPRKYSLPVAVGLVGMLLGGAGETTDVAWHVDFGRDKSLLTPPHVLILAGITGVALAAVLSLLLRGPRAAGSVRVGGRDLPAGGAVALLGSALALGAFPLDGTWHELFGEDLTLWSPTHLLLLGGPTVATLGLLVLLCQGMALGRPRAAARAGQVLLAGVVLTALVDLSSEFAFGVPQFRLLLHPLAVTLAAAFTLVLARWLLGRYGALQVLAVYLVMFAATMLLPLLDPGRTPDRAPLLIVAAVVVELVALRAWRSPIAFGAAAGLGVGTAGLAAEWAWSQVWFPFPWTASLLPEAPLLAALVGLAAGVLGARVAAAARSGGLAAGPVEPVPRHGTLAPALALAAIVVVLGVLLPRPRLDARATLAPFDTRGATTQLRVVLDPPDAARDADWFRVAVFHGGTTEQVGLREERPGVFVSERRFPAAGERDVVLRLARGGSLASVSVYSRGEEADEEPSPLAARTAAFEAEHALPPVEGARATLQKVGYGVVAAIAAGWLLVLWRALRILETRGRGPVAPPGPPAGRPPA